MTRQFNTAGPCRSDDHYMLNPLTRIDAEEIESLIDNKRYFILHAPRQTGKTTFLLALMDYLNHGSRYRALYANIETAQTARNDVAAGMYSIATAIAAQANVWLKDTRLMDWLKEHRQDSPHELVKAILTAWTENSDLPTVLFIDEVDALIGDTLISLLRQIRAGYNQRPQSFPQSIILCGVRDVRDYRIHTAHQEIITGGSAFNIKAESLRLGNFTQTETEELWRLHEIETGQLFDSAIWPELWEDTMGQPWLVNALAHECTWKDRAARRDRTIPITLERYKNARERLIQSRATHLDQLVDKLREERVRGIVAALLAGENIETRYPMDDLQYVEDLGLIRGRPQLTIVNRIYREIIPRELTFPIQVVITQNPLWYLTPQRHLDISKLLTAFQQFFREHSDAWLKGFDYREAGPQLLLQAFLQRIVNGGGRINREYGLGTKRTDLFLEWPIDEVQGYLGPVQRVVMECKLVYPRRTLESTIADGIIQTAEYAERCGAAEAHLLIFDRRPDKTWEERIWQRQIKEGRREIFVWGA